MHTILTDPSLFLCSTADNVISVVCNLGGRRYDKEEEAMKRKEGQWKEKEGEEEEEQKPLMSHECLQERRRQKNENSALEAIWKKAARYWPEHVSVCVYTNRH